MPFIPSETLDRLHEPPIFLDPLKPPHTSNSRVFYIGGRLSGIVNFRSSECVTETRYNATPAKVGEVALLHNAEVAPF